MGWMDGPANYRQEAILADDDDDDDDDEKKRKTAVFGAL
jgi:hypothetical protein